jgi:hypothetical protein
MADEPAELVTVTLTAADWAWLRERLETFARCAETSAEQFAGLLQQPAGEAQRRGDRTALQRDQAQYPALAHDARRLSEAVGRRLQAKTADA